MTRYITNLPCITIDNTFWLFLELYFSVFFILVHSPFVLINTKTIEFKYEIEQKSIKKICFFKL